MQFTPRPYQAEAITKAVEYFKAPKHYGHAIEILPTGSGKSVVIANIAKELNGNTLILQPSKEILEQNVKKYMSYGFRAGIYSASAGAKFLDTVTFATIGSIARKHHLFDDYKYIIMDECHLTNAKEGMYKDFFKYMSHARLLGLTATPYRLSTSLEGAQLKFITRTSPRVYSRVLYYIQNSVLFDAGHLAKLEYFSPPLIDRSRLKLNSSGSDFTEASIRAEYRRLDMPTKVIEYGNRILAKRKNLLIFCDLIETSITVMNGIPGAAIVTGDTEPAVRAKTLADFKSGKIRCLVNVGVLTTGFDYPELEAVLIARSTMSLSLYYQIIGRVMRPHPDKVSGWVVDLGGNIKLFGKIETMKIEQNEKGLYYISNQVGDEIRQLTNVPFTRELTPSF